MKAQVSSTLLGVRDMDRSKRFSTEGLGWKATKQWGGYGGSFADPDGYIWDIGYSAQGKNQPHAE